MQTIYQGDNRTFDPFSQSYRADSEALISSVTGSTVGVPYFSAGTTTRYASDALAPDHYTLIGDSIYHDCHLTDNVVPESNADMHLSVVGGSGTVNANFYGSATNIATNAGSWAPSIDWNITVTLSTAVNPAVPQYTVQYTHDCYPAEEAYIGTQIVYGYLPKFHDAYSIGYCLAGGSQVQGSTQGTVN